MVFVAPTSVSSSSSLLPLYSSPLQPIRIARVERYAKTAKYRYPLSNHKNAFYEMFFAKFSTFFQAIKYVKLFQIDE